MKLRLLVPALLVITMQVFAQSYYGGVRGTVLDQNGGALPGADAERYFHALISFSSLRHAPNPDIWRVF